VNTRGAINALWNRGVTAPLIPDLGIRWMRFMISEFGITTYRHSACAREQWFFTRVAVDWTALIIRALQNINGL